MLRADLAKAQATFQYREARPIVDHSWLDAADDLAFADLFDVLLDAQHAVRGVPDQVGFDEIVRDGFRFTLGGACGNEYCRRNILKRLRRKT